MIISKYISITHLYELSQHIMTQIALKKGELPDQNKNATTSESSKILDSIYLH